MLPQADPFTGGPECAPSAYPRKVEATYTPEALARRIQGVVEVYLEVKPGRLPDNIRVVVS
jgi:hypothetical protein